MKSALIVSLLMTSLLLSAEYPKYYAPLGTPLYDTIRTFEAYEHLGDMAAVNQEFITFVAPIFEQGIRLNQTIKPSAQARKDYLQGLRSIQEKKKWVMHHLTQLTMQATQQDDYKSFKHLVQLPLEELLPTLTTRTLAISYYQRKGHHDIPTLDTLAKEESIRSALKKRQNLTSTAIAEDIPNPYRLKIHTLKKGKNTATTPTEALKDPVAEQEQNGTILKQVGRMFQSMGIDFDPGLLEDYKQHRPPGIEDLP